MKNLEQLDKIYRATQIGKKAARKVSAESAREFEKNIAEWLGLAVPEAGVPNFKALHRMGLEVGATNVTTMAEKPYGHMGRGKKRHENRFVHQRKTRSVE